MVTAEKRIPVTEETRNELHRLKGAGQTYDELLQELVQERNRTELAEKAREIEEMDAEELTSLEDV